MNVEQRQSIERRLVTRLVETMAQHGWAVTHVNNGEAHIKCGTVSEVLEEVFSVDESSIWFKKDGCSPHGALIVLGNDGYDAIADYSYAEDDDFMLIVETYVDPFIEELEKEVHGS